MFKDRNKISRILLFAVLVLCAAALIITLARCGSDGDNSGKDETSAKASITPVNGPEEGHDYVEAGDVEISFDDLGD